jgi:hypothetical protein
MAMSSGIPHPEMNPETIATLDVLEQSKDQVLDEGDL